MNPRWFPAETKKDGKKKEEYERNLKANTFALRRLKEIVRSELAAAQAPKNTDDYTHGWEFKQADRLGQIRAYNNILTLLEFIKDDRRT